MRLAVRSNAASRIANDISEKNFRTHVEKRNSSLSLSRAHVEMLQDLGDISEMSAT